MNRRNFMLTSGALAALTAIPANAVASTATVTMSDGAIDNPHMGIAIKWVKERIQERILYLRDEFFGSTLKLTAPTFHIQSGVPVWSWMTGYTNENGLMIYIKELDIPITKVGIATSMNYEEYFGRERDKKRYPDYFVRHPWMNYEDKSEIEALLPKDHFDIDGRIFDLMSKG